MIGCYCGRWIWLKRKFLIGFIISLVIFLTGCAKSATTKQVPQVFADPKSVQEYMIEQNAAYIETGVNLGDLSADKREDTAVNGQHPHAVVVTCSDSRVPAEHIFNAGIGELFIIRTAGNVIGDYELGSIEYGTEHLGAKLVVVLGHTNCGAVDAALSGEAHGHIKTITDEISSCLPEKCSAREAEVFNIENSINRIKDSEIMNELIADGKVRVVGAIYDIENGDVKFLD